MLTVSKIVEKDSSVVFASSRWLLYREIFFCCSFTGRFGINEREMCNFGSWSRLFLGFSKALLESS